MPAAFATARRRASLVGDMYDPSTFDEDTLRALWEFRMRFVRLRDGVQPADDLRSFCAAVREGWMCYAARDARGALQATGVWVLRQREVAGRPVTFMLVKALYASPAFRGSPRGALAVLEGTTRVVLRHGALGGAVYGGGPVLLPGYLTLLRMSSEAWLVGQMPPEQEAVYRTLVRDFPNCDPHSGVVRELFATLEPEPRRPSRPRLQQGWDDFLARYPRWAEGDIGFALIRLRPRSLLRLLGEGLRRGRRRA